MAKNVKGYDDNGDLILRAAHKISDGVIERADGYLEGTYHPKKIIRKHILRGTTTALVALSLLTGIAFSGPAEIADEQEAMNYRPAPVVMDVDDFVNVPVEDDEDEDDQKTVRMSVIEKFRQAVYSLPQTVRVLLAVPLWALGTALLTLITFLWNVLFASPVGAFIASLAAGFAVLLGLFTVTAKMLFPELPLRSILCKRNILILLGTALFLSVVDAAAPFYWNRYPLAAAGVKLVTGASIITVLSVRTKAAFSRIRNTFAGI